MRWFQTEEKYSCIERNAPRCLRRSFPSFCGGDRLEWIVLLRHLSLSRTHTHAHTHKWLLVVFILISHCYTGHKQSQKLSCDLLDSCVDVTPDTASVVYTHVVVSVSMGWLMCLQAPPWLHVLSAVRLNEPFNAKHHDGVWEVPRLLPANRRDDTLPCCR